MPNIKSAIKRVDVSKKKTLENNMVKSAYKTAIKTFEAAVEAAREISFTWIVERRYSSRDSESSEFCHQFQQDVLQTSEGSLWSSWRQ